MLRNVAEIWRVPLESPSVVMCRESYKAGHHGPVQPKITPKPEIDCGARDLKIVQLDQSCDIVAIRKLSAWLPGLAFSFSVDVVSMQKLH